MSLHTMSVLVEDKPGVLTRVAGLFAARGFNIDSLAVGPTDDAGLSRMTIVVQVDTKPLEQVTKQLNKLVNVIKILEHEAGEAVERVKVTIGEPNPHVGSGQHLREHAGQRGFLLADPAPAAACPAVAGLPADELGRCTFREPSKPVVGLQLGPQQRYRVRHHEPRRLHGVLGMEVLVVTALAGQVDQPLQRGRGGGGVLAAQAVLGIAHQTLEG